MKGQCTVAVMALEKHIAILLERGRFRQAANAKSASIQQFVSDHKRAYASRTEEVAQIFQQDGSDLQEALNAYEKAGEWYDTESAPA